MADIVNLGLIPSSEDGWPVAAQVLRSEGGVMHIHGNVAVPMEKSRKEENQQSKPTSIKYACAVEDSTEQNLPTNEQIIQVDESNVQINKPSDINEFQTFHTQTFQSNCDQAKPLQSETVQLNNPPQEKSVSQIDKHANDKDVCCKENASESLVGLTHSHSKQKDLLMSACNIWSLYVKKKMLKLLNEKKGGSWNVVTMHIEIVKPYAPHIWHVVLDLDCKPQR